MHQPKFQVGDKVISQGRFGRAGVVVQVLGCGKLREYRIEDKCGRLFWAWEDKLESNNY